MNNNPIMKYNIVEIKSAEGYLFVLHFLLNHLFLFASLIVA